VAGSDLTGTLLLAAASTSLLLGISVASGPRLPGPDVIVLLAGAGAAAAGFVARQRRASAPLVDLALLAHRDIAAGLVGALSGYLVLFGPLVLIPVAFADAGLSQLRAGLVLTALPAGFALAATVADRLLPSGWRERTRAVLGSSLSLLALVLAARGAAGEWLAGRALGLLGLALGSFHPGQQHTCHGGHPGQSAATGGGLVNMARSLGTALGVAVVDAGPEHRRRLARVLTGRGLAVLVLAVVSLVTVGSAWAQRGADRG